jgi:ABC-type antimicrobial peptide transport system permease subunit
LNLNQVQNPQLLGIEPQRLNQRGSFSFANTLDFVDVEEPWLALNQDLGEGIIPAIIDQTVITWGLMKKVGDTLLYVDDFGEELKILIAGGLNNSIFQGNVLLSRDNLLKHFPSAAGANILLVDASDISSAEVEELLNFSFRDYGLDYMSTVQRMRDFNSVSNTYLTVFMMLGGLGLLIGTIGFGIILIRNRQERKNEFALLSAIGIKDKSLFKIIFIEHFLMLLLGIGAGLIATAIGIIPSLLSESFSIPLSFIGLILLLILLNGIFWIYLSARNSDKAGSFIDLRND